jgi:hypothetical protein
MAVMLPQKAGSSSWRPFFGINRIPPLLHQVPKVSIEILEHSDSPVALLGRFAHEGDVLRLVGVIVAPKIVRLQKKKDAAASLITNARGLFVAHGSGQKQTGLPLPGRRDHHPALVLLGHGSVLNESEPERTNIEGDRFVVVAHHQRDETDGLIHWLGRFCRGRFGTSAPQQYDAH